MVKSLTIYQCDQIIKGCKNWKALDQAIRSQKGKRSKGNLFERFTQLYFQTKPEYLTKFKNVWLLEQVPKKVYGLLNLPSEDKGIDLVAETYDGDYQTIQSKYRSNKDKPLTLDDLTGFGNLSFNFCKNISFGYIVTTTSQPIKNIRYLGKVTELGNERWLSLTEENWQLIKEKLGKKAVRPKPYKPSKHQQEVIDKAYIHFIKKGENRGTMIMPCGSGKSLAAFWVSQKLKAQTILVAVPSLSLIKQSLESWMREYTANKVHPDWLCVCSDDSVSGLEADNFVADVYETGIETTTDPNQIIEFLGKPTNKPKIVFTTYQSSPKMMEVQSKTSFEFDLCILDEAHRTVGDKRKAFSTLLYNDNLKARKRMFMTATERVYRGTSNEIVSMSDREIYGDYFYQLTFKQAIASKIICDYQVITISITEEEIEELVSKNGLVFDKSVSNSEHSTKELAVGIVLQKMFQDHGVKHAVSFHNSIKLAKRFRKQQDLLNSIYATNLEIENFHISSKLSSGQRSSLLENFKLSEKALITNARCLTEGVDIPLIDCVVFANPRRSVIDIVQAAGRAMRVDRTGKKKLGYLLLPVVVPEGMGFQEFFETNEFKHVAKIISALSTQDERIAEEFREGGKPKQNPRVIMKTIGSVNFADQIDLTEFTESIKTVIWKTVAIANMRPFEEARTFVRSQNLKNDRELKEWQKSENRPPDIPTNPRRTYGKEFVDLPDWIGVDTVAPQNKTFLPQDEGIQYVNRLNLGTLKAWQAYCVSGEKPANIPSNPRHTYGKQFVGMGVWLGTGRVATQKKLYWEFERARSFAHALKLNDQREWKAYVNSGKLPKTIPSNPNGVNQYKKNWIDWGDWLGTGNKAVVPVQKNRYRPFNEARGFARSLNFKSKAHWMNYKKSGKIPQDIPLNPHVADQYKKDWKGWPDWLGY